MSDHEFTFDMLNDAWRAAEDHLRSLRCPLPVFYRIPKTQQEMSFQKIDGEWRICIFFEGNYRPILNCQMGDRIGYAKDFHGLLEAVIARRVVALSLAHSATFEINTCIEQSKKESKSDEQN